MNKNGIENLNEQRDASSHLEQSLEKFNLSRSESTELESLVKQQDTASDTGDGSERVSGNEAKEKQTASADLDPRINKGVNRREGVHPSFGGKHD